MNWQQDWRDTPVWIISRDRLELGLRQLVDWLQRAGIAKIGIIDNKSTWPPLLKYYETLHGVQIVHAGSNLGHEAFWRLDFHLPPVTPVGSRYIVTDCDVVPDPDCPLDLVRKMHEVADRKRFHPIGAKVGPAIRIDNIPACYDKRDHMRMCESDYWLRRYPENDCWNAAIDTTFALYSAGWTRWPNAADGGVSHVRLDFPYVVNHVPWFSDSANLSAEERYYRAHVENGYSSSCPVAIPEE